MRNLKRVLSLALASIMLLGMMVVGAGAASKDFTDSDEIKNVEAVDVMVALGVLEGGDKGDFQPNSILTREQAAKIICYLLLGEEDAEKLTTNYPIFSDVPANRWSAPYISYCVNLGILAGDGHGNFYPEGKLTGVAFGKMLMVALGYSAEREKFVGNNWEINVSAAAIAAGVAPKGLVLSNELSRQDAAQMAFNTLQATMVEYLNDNTIIIGNTTVSSVGKASAVAQNPYKDTMDAEYLQFAEKYFGGLKKVPAQDEFMRPAISWRNNAKLVGTYTLDSDLTYTSGVELGDIYKDLGLSKAKDTDEYYEDGKELKAVTLKKGNDTTIGANGVLTQVWYDESEDGSNLVITEINTYVGKVNTVNKASGANDRYITLAKASAAPSALNTKFETEGFEKDDLVLYTAAWNESSSRYDIQTVETLEKSATGILTEWNGSSANLGDDDKGTANKNFTVDGETYKYSVNAYVVDENGFGSATDISAFDVDESELNVYLDNYGYAIYVSGVEGETNYAAVIGIGNSNQYGDEVNGVTLLLPDGTKKSVKAKLSSGLNWTDFSYASGKNLVNDGVADLVTYSVGDDDVYTLTLAKTTPAKYDATNYTTAGDIKFVNGKSLFELVTPNKTMYTTSETIFMVATKDGAKKAYNVYTGYENMPSIDQTKAAEGIAYICNKNYPTQIDVVYLSVENLAGISSVDTYVVKSAGASVITNSKGDYYILPAIVDGEEKDVKISADYVASTAVFTKKNGDATANFEEAVGLYALNNVIVDKNDIITGFSVVNRAVFNAENGGVGTVAANKVVLGLNGNKNTATYWAYNDKTNVYVVDKNYKNITVSSVANVATDANDLVFASHDGGSPEKKLNDVIIVEREDVVLSSDTSFKTMTVKGQTAVKQPDGTYAVTVPSTALNGVNSAFDFDGNGARVKTASYSFDNGSTWTDNWAQWNANENSSSWSGQTGLQFKYVVEAADGVTTQTYVVKVNVVDTITLTFKSNDATQAYVTVNGGTPTLIDNSKTVIVDVAKGAVVTLNIVPASGKTVNSVASAGNFVSGNANSYQIIANATADVVITLA